MKNKIKVTEVDEDLGIIDEIIKNAPKQDIHFVDRYSEITEQIFRILKEKGWKQKDLADAMGKSDAEISKWLCGSYNFTLRTLSHIEVALNEKIFYTKAGRQLENEILERKEHVWYATINPVSITSDTNSEPLIPQNEISNGSTKAA